ncbi:MAG TPA: Hsp20/alpha crystallin family protein [Abditibacteriaceae bacterium]|nr:Hsp20/alpha crystallin family protein [Abditibacteriaceae bacterium]
MSLIRYTPYPISNLQQQINRVFDQVDPTSFESSEGLSSGMFAPAVDVKENAEAYTVAIEVPGVKQENLNLTLQDNVLIIRGHKEQAQEQSAGQYRRVERSYGSFARSLALPRNVDANGVTANLQDGVLHVRLPKHETAKPRQINIAATVPGAEAPPASGDKATTSKAAAGKKQQRPDQ